MATHSSVLAWRIPGTGAWWAAVYGVAQSRTRLKRLGGSSSFIIFLFLSFFSFSECSVPEAGGTFHQFPKLGLRSPGAPCSVEKTVLQ